MKRPWLFSRLPARMFAMILVLILIPSISMMYFVKGYMERLLHDEISDRVAQSLQQSENEIENLFYRMANISTTFLYSQTFTEAFADDSRSHYDRFLAFRSVLSGVTMQNLFQYTDNTLNVSISQFKITFFDKRGELYTSWSQDFQDYSYLAEQAWMRDDSVSSGHIIWNTHALGYAPLGDGARHDQLAMAREIIAGGIGREGLGTLLISIDQAQIAGILSGYKYSGDDIVFAYVPDEEALFTTDADSSVAAGIAGRHGQRSRGSEVVDVDGVRYLLSYYTVNNLHIGTGRSLKIYYLTDYRSLGDGIRRLMTGINLSCVVFVVLVLLLALWISTAMARPIRRLAGDMRRYTPGDVPDLADTRRPDEIGEITRAYSGMARDIHELLGRLRREQETKERYRFESLRAKMSPHFLFNTLTSLRYMAIIRGADNIRDGIDSLADILRYSLSEDGELVPLSREIEVVRSYCAIHNMRTGDAVRLEVDIDGETLRRSVIKFILQPAVENCFKHAFRGGHGDGVIRIAGATRGGRIELSVSDNGAGFPPAVLEAYRREGRFHTEGAQKRSGIGLDIVNQRIRIGYGEEYGIEPDASPTGGAMLLYHLKVLDEEAEVRADEADHDR